MLIQIDGTFIFVVISFLIFLFIIKAILYHPFTKIIDERESFLAKNSKMEQESKEKAKALLEDKEYRIKKARAEAGEIIKDATCEAKNAGMKILKETKRQVQKEADENRKILEESQINAKHELKSEISGFVTAIVSKILNEQIEVNIEEDKIDKYLKI